MRCFAHILAIQLPCRREFVQDGNRRVGTQLRDHAPNTSQCSQHQSSARFAELYKKSKNEVSGIFQSLAFFRNRLETLERRESF